MIKKKITTLSTIDTYQKLRKLLMDETGCIPIEEALRKAKEKYPKTKSDE